MLTQEINEHDVVRLRNGREGAVVHVYTVRPGQSPAYEIELLPGDGDLVTVEHGEVAEVLDPFIPERRIMVKLALSPRQKALWREISVPFDFDAEYDDDTLVALEEYLSDYMLYHETANDELTPRRDEVHALLSYITTEIDV
ncbi:MAG: hypothetical protein ROW48_17705 [Bellilinea sp.]|jgi:hypothetical protein